MLVFSLIKQISMSNKLLHSVFNLQSRKPSSDIVDMRIIPTDIKESLFTTFIKICCCFKGLTFSFWLNPIIKRRTQRHDISLNNKYIDNLPFVQSRSYIIHSAWLRARKHTLSYVQESFWHVCKSPTVISITKVKNTTSFNNHRFNLKTFYLKNLNV